ncbi:hypothetical protein Leryth_014465 [Lithospermum erythrorhizon]|nr:hypothetical protein Leryth_014465 [Lithospermum erythrorhizon]
MMKRSMEDREVEALAMANFLMQLARVGNNPRITSSGPGFECKTKKSGHKASHKKPRLLTDNEKDVSKLKKHECSICKFI